MARCEMELGKDDAKKLAKVLSVLGRHIVLQDESRPSLTMLKLGLTQDGRLTLTGANGFLLATVEVPWKVEPLDAAEEIFSGERQNLLDRDDREALVAMLKLRAKGAVTLAFTLADGEVEIAVQDQAVAKLREDESYPAYQELVERADGMIGQHGPFAISPKMLGNAAKLFGVLESAAVKFRSSSTGSNPVWMEGYDSDAIRYGHPHWQARCLAMPMQVEWDERDGTAEEE